MNFRHLLHFGISLTAVVAHAERSPPNILLIVSEDHGPELGCYGEPHVRTPNLDTLARAGVRFEAAYVTQAGCSPSRASILTGLYPHQNGQIGLATWGFRMYADDLPTMPGILREAGYRTGIIGKLHINPASAFDFDLGEISSPNFRRRNLADYARNADRFFGAGDEPFFLMVTGG
ncbi:MAG: sulfatase-like hydrolase/transferase [Opitutales bacterium]|nr:sulfatase-like hydrolase/transferase [Opitutales bacterium]